MTTRQTKPLSLSAIEARREIVLVAFTLFIGMSLMVAGFYIVYLKVTQNELHEQLVRTDDEFISGGKRFIDYFYSLNAATVDNDQYRAISMMCEQAMREARLQEIAQVDLVRKTQQSRMRSHIDWVQSEINLVTKQENGHVDIRYKTYLVRNDELADPLDIVLTLVAQAKTDTNTDGVCLMAWVDVAKDPFAGGTNEAMQ